MTVPEDANELHMWLAQTADSVKFRLSSLETNFVTPAVQRGQAFAHANPVTATFAAIFAFWSTLPILCFLGFSTLVAVSFISVALACALFAALVVIFFAGFILALTLTLTLGLSLFLTGFTFLVFVSIRLIYHVRSDQGAGVQGWAEETKGRFAVPTQFNLKVASSSLMSKRESSEEWEKTAM